MLWCNSELMHVETLTWCYNKVDLVWIRTKVNAVKCIGDWMMQDTFPVVTLYPVHTNTKNVRDQSLCQVLGSYVYNILCLVVTMSACISSFVAVATVSTPKLVVQLCITNNKCDSKFH